ncbi:hypothetical protein ZIOFF_056380 [Zingiber officinale]|uniref:Trichome birefringence-like C-terminal domain-containing protein n=1 Tax=Zingiber officinale TaxID=94328 RepID=A0A8J5KPD3_ZINOF|nr:hypothetical protein ZIOFF_056380 [Zingiber officinale]
MLFVADSLNREQFVSMVCLLHRLIPDNAKSMEIFDSLTIFMAKGLNATIEFDWAPFRWSPIRTAPREGCSKLTTKKVAEMKTEEAYRLALRWMRKWVGQNVDPRGSRTFLVSMSPTHSRGNCYDETSPIRDQLHPGGIR